MPDLAKTWGVIEVGGQLVHNTGRHSFQVMRTEDAEAALDALVDKAAAAVKKWRLRAEALGYVAPDGCDGSCPT